MNLECCDCKETKDSTEFTKHSYKKRGFSYRCKSCQVLFRFKNKDRLRKNSTKSWHKNKHKKQTEEYKLKKAIAYKKHAIKNRKNLTNYYKKWRDANKERENLKNRLKRENNTQVKLSIYLRTRLNSAIKGNFKGGSAVKDLGCSIQDLKFWLEFWFDDGMNWNNWSKNGWHIDHIKPLASFDLIDKNQLLEACNYKNLQPMWAIDNIKKADKL